MTKTLRIGAAGIAMFVALGMGSAAHAQETATADATAEILEALDFQVAGALDFGAIIMNGGNVGVVLAPDGSSNCGTLTGIFCRGTMTNPTFTVTGTADKQVYIEVPAGSVTLTTGAGGAGNEMTITNFSTSATATDALGRPEVTLTGGTASFTVGGTLNIGGTQNAGVYDGQFDVTVDYQ